ncbi:MAG: PHB depolymerase family esterase [Pseudomonadota bacterium]
MMKKLLRLLGYLLAGLATLVAIGGILFAWFVYSPDPELPKLSGTLAKGSIDVNGLKRSYVTYVPKGLAPGAPLVLVMHGSGEDAQQIRIDTGYGFERLADRHGFAIAYPNSYTFDWNDCSRVGDFKANGREVDDVGFLTALTDKLAGEMGSDRARVFATGVSAGGFMSLRLALEAPARFRAVAAVSANVPAPDNFKCQPAGRDIPVMLMSGTKDPLVPFEGGEVNLLGFFYINGNVLSARQSGQYFATRHQISSAPDIVQGSAGSGVERVHWRQDDKAEVELVAIHGGGHGMPQPYWRRPRLLGPSPMDPDGTALIWAFFARQPAAARLAGNLP